MSNHRIATIACSFVLLGGITLLAAPTREEQDAIKYADTLKSSTNTKERVTALKELARLGRINVGLTKPAVPEIIKALEDKDPKVRAEAAHTIGAVDPVDKAVVVGKLVKMLKEEKDEAVREGVAMGLGAMGSSAKDGLGALRDAAKNAGKKDAKTYQAAIMSITGKTKN